MTSASANPAAGDWGGLVICGDAPTNKGLTLLQVADLSYGGNNPNDSSGSIKYLRVEYTGATFSNDKFNGFRCSVLALVLRLSLCNPSTEDDGIEFFGGSVNGNNLVSVGSGDDSIDFADGWTGTGTNWYIWVVPKRGLKVPTMGKMETPLSNDYYLK